MSPAQKLDSNNTPRYFEGRLIPDIDQYGENPVVIRLTDEERISCHTKPETLQQCLTIFHRDGFVVLENAIDDDLVDKLYNRMVEENEIYLGKKFMQWNQGAATKNVSQIPPLTPEWLKKDFYANPHMLSILENLLGPRPEIRFLNANVAVPGATGRQAVHSDVNHDYPSIPFGVVMNTYLQDSDAGNGVTEIWCGTHNRYRRDEQQAQKESGWIKKEAIQSRAKERPPVQPKVRKGSICFRDLRLWHAGMPNTSDKHRIMLAIDYFAQWYQCPMMLRLPIASKAEVESWGINTAGIEWVEGKFDHLEQPFYLNMTQDPEMYIKQTPQGVEDWRARKTGKFEFDRGVVTDQNYWTPE
jgi:ectoine hydroxylase-related dioxygenase (phytanoyl-CoA dioxygenase family)